MPIDSTELRILADYAARSAETDVLDSKELTPVLQGLFGEVGGLMATAKKHVREGAAYPSFQRSAVEEFGDTLWYFTAVCRRLNLQVDAVFAAVSDAHVDLGESGTNAAELDRTLFALGRATAALLVETPERGKVEDVARHYLGALRGAKIALPEVLGKNLAKIGSAFVEPKIEDLEDFDAKFEEEEQLPRSFRIQIKQRVSGRSYLRLNKVFVGDPLTDNIKDRDGYRFHDVFHFSYAAILHWSPVMRALLKQKRKSVEAFDEEQDSGRAIVVEEGLTAWIFSRAKDLRFFEGQRKVSLDILKTISEFVAGYEVDRCPLKLWERAILDGYDVFRKVRSAQGGWVVGDRATRTIRFEPLEEQA